MNYILIAVIIIVLLCLFKTKTKENFKCGPKSFSLNNYIEDYVKKPEPESKTIPQNYVFSRPNKVFSAEKQILKSGCMKNINLAFPTKCFSCESQSSEPYFEGPTKCFSCKSK